MSTDPKNKSRFRPVEEQADRAARPVPGMSSGVRRALRRARFRLNDAVECVREQIRTSCHRSAEQPSRELTHSDRSSPTSREVTGALPDLAPGQPFPGVQFFALVDLTDPSRVHHYGVDTGTGAFTFRCDPDGGHKSRRTASVDLAAMGNGRRRQGIDLRLRLFVGGDGVPPCATASSR
jgi:hypothetical protein